MICGGQNGASSGWSAGSTTIGYGGDGRLINIDGTSRYYAGGGGGTSDASTYYGVGGQGGGGQNGGAGTINTGGGLS